MEISAVGDDLPLPDEKAASSEVKQEEQPFRLRSYQYELLEESLTRNTIIALDTGSGKTHM